MDCLPEACTHLCTHKHRTLARKSFCIPLLQGIGNQLQVHTHRCLYQPNLQGYSPVQAPPQTCFTLGAGPTSFACASLTVHSACAVWVRRVAVMHRTLSTMELLRRAVNRRIWIGRCAHHVTRCNTYSWLPTAVWEAASVPAHTHRIFPLVAFLRSRTSRGIAARPCF